MSRAVSTVLKVPRASPYSSAQPSATSSVSAKASSSCSSVVGRGSAATSCSFSSSGMHSTGVDRPTPRGSKPTMSNRLQHLLGQGQRQADRGVGARGARPAGVDHQRADPVGLPGQHDADEEQRQRGALGLVVADRHLGAAALEGQVRGRCRAGRRSAAGSASLQSVHSISRRLGLGRGRGRRGRRTRRRRCPRTRCSRTAPGSAASRLGGTAGRPRCRRMITSVGAARRAAADDHSRSGDAQPGQDLGQVVAHRHVQLVVRAAQRVPVGPPAEELAGVTKSTAFELVVLDLHDQFRAQRHPRQVLLRVPPADRAGHPVLGAVLARPGRSPSPATGARRGRSPGRAPAPRPARPAAPSGRTPRRRCAGGRRRRCRGPSSSEPTIGPLLCQRNPATTQSAVRTCLTLVISRWSGP